jgi:hypothetical protein
MVPPNSQGNGGREEGGGGEGGMGTSKFLRDHFSKKKKNFRVGLFVVSKPMATPSSISFCLLYLNLSCSNQSSRKN